MGACVYETILFDWDDQKHDENPVKHDGVTFEDGMEACLDPTFVAQDASRHDEFRMGIIGYTRRNVLLLVATDPYEDGTGYRMISARKVTKSERELYEEGV